MTRIDDENTNVKIPCENARTLVPSYLDGELGEAQASPLRNHLLDCPSCREIAKEERALKRWFEARRVPNAMMPPVPDGFSSHVARRAFAGDRGTAWDEIEPALPRRSHLSFLLGACAVAAAVVLVLALVIRRETLPKTTGLEAQQYRPPWLPAEAVPAGVETLERLDPARPVQVKIKAKPEAKEAERR